ncbi:MAG: protein TolQ [Desulfobacteraceae bacterium]
MSSDTLGFFYLLSEAGTVVKIVLLLLLFFSITTWAIIFIKYRYIRKAYRESEEFTDLFWQCKTMKEAFSKARALKTSPVARIFMTGYLELAKLNEGGQSHGAADKAETVRGRTSSVQTLNNVQRSLRRAGSIEVRRLSQLVPFLATAGNTSPFIGLFGTVWGIMNTFQGIGVSGSASLAVVAPGISEALVATAAGLAVAIPSVIAYNYFINQIRILDGELQGFSSDFLNIVERDLQRQREV